ncbi:bifunctional 4-hydroxy-2-oxoglutarate aldolase/2-dehydro-3-deoxy-phosphogluconate aldolase [Sulfurospirillum sp. 1612]|uniref:bifunctional 4-hydroxy-2-oxoglutarate aldolase/2-dehydro-3-deoxy-phosphogluconate aldolase n=1 Tax=Sulfurospirillum sp. 1612 TaxID=3094835 RepID=UPI002F947DF1
MTTKEIMEISPIVPVIALDDVQNAVPLALALLEAGIHIMEVTLRTEDGLKAIEKIAKIVPQMQVGAGTVVNKKDFRYAIDAGASFVFSPGINQELMDYSIKKGVTFIPGVATASDIMMAQNNGFYYCKLFPATTVGGVSALKSFAGPFPKMKFCPTGGINLKNVKDFLQLDNVLCAGGSWLVPKSAIQNKDFNLITQLSKEALNAIT